MREFWYDYVNPKKWTKRKLMLYAYSQLYNLFKSRRHLRRHREKCKN